MAFTSSPARTDPRPSEFPVEQHKICVSLQAPECLSASRVGIKNIDSSSGCAVTRRRGRGGEGGEGGEDVEEKKEEEGSEDILCRCKRNSHKNREREKILPPKIKKRFE